MQNSLSPAELFENGPAAIFPKGKEATQNGQLSLGEEDFRPVIALGPKSSAAYVNLDLAYMREKRWDDSLVQLHKAESFSGSSGDRTQ